MNEDRVFAGWKLNDRGEIPEAYPIITTQISDVTKKMLENTESYVIEQCVHLGIDPKVLEAQLREIQRLKMVIAAMKRSVEENFHWAKENCNWEMEKKLGTMISEWEHNPLLENLDSVYFQKKE